MTPESFAVEFELGLGSLRHEIRGHDGSDCGLSTSRNAIGPMAPQTVFLDRLRPLARVQSKRLNAAKLMLIERAFEWDSNSRQRRGPGSGHAQVPRRL